MLLKPDIEYIPNSTLCRAVIFVFVLLFGWLFLWGISGFLCFFGRYLELYVLYFFLSFPAFNITVLILEKVKLLSAEAKSNAGFRYTRLVCFLLIPALIVCAGAYNNEHPQLRLYSL